MQWLLDKSAILGWGPSRAPVRSGEEAPEAIATSAATMVDGGPFDVTSAVTLIDAAPFGGQETGAQGWSAARAWDAGRDAQPTQGMNRAAIRGADDGVRQARRFRRRGAMALAWLALATSGVLCTMMEGNRPAAGQSDAPPARPPTAGWGVGGGGAAGQAVGQERPLALTWMGAVSEQIRCALDSMGVHPAPTARGQFEGKMEEARARRCPTVQNAEPIEAEQLSSSRARSVGTRLSPASARPSARDPR